MKKSTMTATRALRFGAAALAAFSLLALAGCGAEEQKIVPNTTPTAVPGGGSEQDYKKGMQGVLDAQKGGTPTPPGQSTPR